MARAMMPHEDWAELFRLAVVAWQTDDGTHRTRFGGPGMLIRAALPSDAAEIFAVHTSAIREVCGAVYDAAQVHAWTCRKRPEGYLEPIARHPFFVAVVDGSVVGFSELNPETGEVCAVYVRPDRIRQKIGHGLLQTVEAVAHERSLSRLHLSATLNAVPFYQNHGYILDGQGSVLLGGGTNLPCANMHKELDVLTNWPRQSR